MLDSKFILTVLAILCVLYTTYSVVTGAKDMMDRARERNKQVELEFCKEYPEGHCEIIIKDK